MTASIFHRCGVAVLFAALSVTSAQARECISGTACASATPTLRVLFVGNSYLFVNRLPDVVASLAAPHGTRLEVTMRAEPDFALSDHLRHRRTLAAFEREWDWVVLQQGPSSREDSRRELIDSVRRIAARLDGRAARIGLMSAWPQQRYLESSLEGERSYRLAAAAIDACVLPVATAWRLAREAAPGLRLYQSDRLHPTPTGTVLAALTILPGLVEPARATLAPALPDAPLPEQQRLRALDAAARAANDVETERCVPVGVESQRVESRSAR
jgi:hypothetical protein